MRMKLLTDILATHNIVPDKAGTVVEIEDEVRANQLIAFGYAEETSDKLTEETAGAIMLKQHNDRLLADKKRQDAEAASKAAETKADLEAAEKADAAGERIAAPVIGADKAAVPAGKNAGAAPQNKGK